VAEQAAPATALINDWSLISGRSDASYTITVKTDQESGTYRLAEGAADFAKTVTVKTTADEILGTLDVGSSLKTEYGNYTLTKDAGVLSLSVDGATTPVIAKSDVDGNGVSDVVLQYIGGDYRIGYWMNGTDTWRDEEIGLSPEWEILGAYDMDNNGKADCVVRGNIQTESENGAYIGYYQDGDVAKWQNIDYLNNVSNVDWRLAIGNITGNKGANSIVWHAPELGALGVWTDGTSNWIRLQEGFGSGWEIQGCGDFDGNGKDEILFAYCGSFYTTDIDQNFVSLGGWGADWTVKAIGDFSGDGKDDLILQNGNMVVKFENGLAENWSSLGAIDSSDWAIVGAGDYNGDRKDDLLVRQNSTGMLSYYSSGDMDKWNYIGNGIDKNWAVIA